MNARQKSHAAAPAAQAQHAGSNRPQVYEGDGDSFMKTRSEDAPDRIILLPDSLPSKVPDTTRRVRIMWGQHLLEDLLEGRYRSVVCAVNAEDNRRGIIAQLAALLPTSQWDQKSITAYAAQFGQTGGKAKVLKFDFDSVEALAIMRPPGQKSLTLDDLSAGFKIVTSMLRQKSSRLPSATVSFLGARVNSLKDASGHEPSFEAVMRTMYDAGYAGDIYPAPQMWSVGPIGVYARYPFADSLDQMRGGGF